jgi:diaminohydroxyphosphoribosylaminopyrimidine deaminase/5-amino-6-(5-phosphoribosylamino)uracil reductase
MKTVHPDIDYMQRCIALALKGGNHTKTNPMVGSVLVYNNQIIGEGYHQKYGEAHAEINAIRSVSIKNKPFIPFATLYVSLEPCSHFGKTPPCAHRIVEEGIKNVVIGCEDPNPVVAGDGIKYLTNNGVQVICPVMKESTELLLSKFKANLKGYPFVILKWAQSLDHYISKTDSQTWLSNEYSRIVSHQWRSEADAIMIGKNTALIDNPSLDVRAYTGTSPIRTLMDTNLNVSRDKNIFKDEKPSIIINKIKDTVENNLTYVKVEDTADLSDVLKKLFQLGITSLLVEGGTTLLQSFIKKGLWHEARVIKTKIKLGDGLAAPKIDGRLIHRKYLKDDEILEISNVIPFKYE